MSKKDSTKPRFNRLRRVARGVVGGAIAHTIPLGGESAAYINATRTIKKKKLNKHDAKLQYAKHLAIAQVPLVGDTSEGYRAGANSNNIGELREIGRQAHKRWKDSSTRQKVGIAALSGVKMIGAGLTYRYVHKRAKGFKNALRGLK